MQIINKTHKCSNCGCIAFPDSTHCPKCGMLYYDWNVADISEGVLRNTDNFTFIDPEPREVKITQIHCNVTSSYHREVRIVTKYCLQL